MDIGWQEIIIIIVIIAVLFGVFKMFGDKRYFKRSGNSGSSTKDSGDNKA